MILFKRSSLLPISVFVLTFCGIMFFATGVAGARKTPYNATQDYVDKVMQVFQKHNVCSKKKISREKQQAIREELSQMAKKIFDFEYMCRKAVGPYWRVFTEKQRKQAVRLFSKLLETNYFDKMMEQLQDIRDLKRENIQVKNQEMLSSEKALVKSIIYYQDKKYPVNYIMRIKDDQWRIYDVEIEGVSLVNNYSSQFREILSRNKPRGFLQKLQDKVAEEE